MNTIQGGAREDLRPWKTVEVPLSRGEHRTVTVATADWDKVMRGGRDKRWPVGSAMNPVAPGTSSSSAAMDKLARKGNNPREDNNDF